MFNKILIANRGEIALRIIRACREMGIPSVAVFSEADRESLHVRAADEAYCIGPPPSSESYLDISRIIDTAVSAGADAIHPGYGFLAENPEFAARCDEKGIVFIGPSPEPMQAMGNKITARKSMIEAGVPVVPGGTSGIDNISEAKRLGDEIGYPLMLKAASGGGGKGMRVVRRPDELQSAIEQASGEALGAFGDGTLYFEKLLIDPRHIEIQILADKFGNVVHLGERECSIQRRHQKLIEESPSPIISEEMRDRMGSAAVAAARAAGYNSVGTVEFLVDKDMNFFFLEMNTRLQVEHPVTEMVTGLDIVKEQINIAAGLPLSVTQEDVTMSGTAIECRICTEDPYNNFFPSAGKVYRVIEPGGPGVRLDSSCFSSGNVSLYYDSLVAKLITWGKNREEAISRMEGALSEYRILGIRTNIPFHQAVLRDPLFRNGEFDTGYVANHYKPSDPSETGELISMITAVFLKDRRVTGQRTVSSGSNGEVQISKSAWKMSGRPGWREFGI